MKNYTSRRINFAGAATRARKIRCIPLCKFDQYGNVPNKCAKLPHKCKYQWTWKMDVALICYNSDWNLSLFITSDMLSLLSDFYQTCINHFAKNKYSKIAFVQNLILCPPSSPLPLRLNNRAEKIYALSRVTFAVVSCEE